MAEALPYQLGWRRGPSRPERWRTQLIPETSPDITKRRSLAQYTGGVLFDQGAMGSCTANAGCLAAMMVANIAGQPVPTLSRMYMYYEERLIINTFPQDSGADVIDEFDVDQNPGNIAESVWAYDAKPAERPPGAAATATHYKTVAAYQPIASSAFRDGILTALDNNQPVSIGFNFFNGWFNDWGNSGIFTSAGMDYVAGGHAIVIIGWVPPSGMFAKGAYLIQNSWGASSPDNTHIDPDCTPGRGFLPADVFAMNSVGGEADAVVGMSAPAVLSVAVSAPSTAMVGQPSAWSATVTGAPLGSVISYGWTFSDGGTASGQTASYTPKAAGTLTGTCKASVATTGANAQSSGSVVVTAAPTPGPTPTPAPSDCKAHVDAVCLQVQASLASVAQNDTRPANTPIPLGHVYPYVATWLTFEQDSLDSGLTADQMILPGEPGAVEE